MVTTFVRPWKNEGELLEVRDLFYPDGDLDDGLRWERQQLAVNIVNTWKLRRCRIPHSILATADLVDAILHHDTKKNSLSTIKAVYASALAKMVTSVCDLEQDAAEKRSMMEQAAKLGMPEEWVQLRHAITHGQTPGLKVLESAVKNAVPWMWEHFWNNINGEDRIGNNSLRDEFRKVLAEYRSQRRAMITSKQASAEDTSMAAQASNTLKGLCRKHRDGLDELLHLLLYENFLLPSEKQINLKFKALELVWNELLLKLAERQSKLQTKLALALAQLLASWPIESSRSSGALSTASKWLQHILLDPTWSTMCSPPAFDDLRCDIAEWCLMNKTEYTDNVLQGLLGALQGDQAASLIQLHELCKEHETSDEIEIEGGGQEEDVLPHRTGWSQPVAIWVPRPIGN